MSFVVCEDFFTGVAQPAVPQQPILNTGIAVNNIPAIPIVQLPAIADCTIMAMPNPSLKNRIKFQLLNIACFIDVLFNFIIQPTAQLTNDFASQTKLLFPFCG